MSVVHALSHIQPGEIHLLKTGKTEATKAFVEGYATNTGGITVNGGLAFIKPFGHVSVQSGGGFSFVDEYNDNFTKVIFSGITGVVDLLDKHGNDFAELNFKVSTPASQYTFDPSTKLHFTLQRWLMSPGPFGEQYLGKVIHSGTATLSFPNGVPSAAGATAAYVITFNGY